SSGGGAVDAMSLCCSTKASRRLPCEGGSGKPTGTPSLSSGAGRRAISGQPQSAQPATNGSRARAAYDSSVVRHAAGKTKTRSWRRSGPSAWPEREVMNPLRDVGRLRPALAVLAEEVPAIADTLVGKQHLELVGERPFVVPHGEHRTHLRQVVQTRR